MELEDAEPLQPGRDVGALLDVDRAHLDLLVRQVGEDRQRGAVHRLRRAARPLRARLVDADDEARLAEVLRASDHLDVRAHREELGEELRLEGQGLRQLLVLRQDHHRTTVGRDVLHDAHQVLEVAVDDADDVVLRERRLRPAGEACSGGRGAG